MKAVLDLVLERFIAYIDEILMYGRTESEHMNNVELVPKNIGELELK